TRRRRRWAAPWSTARRPRGSRWRSRRGKTARRAAAHPTPVISSTTRVTSRDSRQSRRRSRRPGKSRQRRQEHAPLAGNATHPHVAALRLDEAAREGETEARALHLRRPGGELLELHEEPGQIGLRDPDAGVLDLDPEMVVVGGDDARLDRTAVGCEL